MIPIPAIDLSRGRAVRLLRGEKTARTDYGDPIDFARRWAAEGAERVHVVNLDGAFSMTAESEASASDMTAESEASAGEGNLAAISEIVRVAGVPVEVGGGLRDEAAVGRILDGAGAAYAVLGTRAIADPAAAGRICARWPDRIYLGLDVKAGRARGTGWTDEGRPWREVLASWRDLGARGVIATAVERDGALAGPDLEFLRAVAAAAAPLRVVASGGVGRLEDLAVLRATGLFEGAIVGKALYEKRFTLSEARAFLRG